MSKATLAEYLHPHPERGDEGGGGTGCFLQQTALENLNAIKADGLTYLIVSGSAELESRTSCRFRHDTKLFLLIHQPDH